MNRSDIESLITDLVTRQLSNGVVPWQKPYTSSFTGPTNLSTGSTYSGVNWLVLWMQPVEHQLWLTYKQAQALGGNVRAGSKGIHCIKYGTFDSKKVDAKGKPILKPFLSSFVLFNIADVDGIEIPAKYLVQREAVDTLPAVELMRAGFKNCPPIYHAATVDVPHWNPMTDSIHLPLVADFKSPEKYAAVLAHEMTHSTGHQSRTDRLAGQEPYSCAAGRGIEELIAEIGACMLMAHYEIAADYENSASYIAGWLKALKNDPAMIVKASAKAQKAVDHITGIRLPVEEGVKA